MNEEVKDQENQESQDGQNKQKSDNSKDAKTFDALIKRAEAVLGGKGWAAKTKVSGEDVPILMKRLTEKRKEDLFREFEKQALELIEQKQKFDAFEREKRAEMEKAILEKKKEFNKKSQELWKMVDKIESIEKEYYDTLNSIATPVESNDPPAQTSL